MLTHENTDVGIEVINLFTELFDEDVLLEADEDEDEDDEEEEDEGNDDDDVDEDGRRKKRKSSGGKQKKQPKAAKKAKAISPVWFFVRSVQDAEGFKALLRFTERLDESKKDDVECIAAILAIFENLVEAKVGDGGNQGHHGVGLVCVWRVLWHRIRVFGICLRTKRQ